MRSRTKHALERIDTHLPEWARQMIRTREWQRSSALSLVIWILGTTTVYVLVSKLGHGWKVNAAVSLVFDAITYVANKLWSFRGRKASVAKSGSRNTVVWVIFFLVNLGLAWVLINLISIGAPEARVPLGLYGIAINPVMFVIRDKAIFTNLTVAEVIRASWRMVRKAAGTWRTAPA